jgi:hypothetical protein
VLQHTLVIAAADRNGRAVRATVADASATRTWTNIVVIGDPSASYATLSTPVTAVPPTGAGDTADLCAGAAAAAALPGDWVTFTVAETTADDRYLRHVARLHDDTTVAAVTVNSLVEAPLHYGVPAQPGERAAARARATEIRSNGDADRRVNVLPDTFCTVRHTQLHHLTGHTTPYQWAMTAQQLDGDVVRAGGATAIRQLPIPTKGLTFTSIVKNVADWVEDGISSVDGVADGVCMYDTGSTDGSVELLRARDVHVIEGWWDDDFSRARNDALWHCRSVWMIPLDGDSFVEVDPTQPRETVLRNVFNKWQDSPAEGAVGDLYNMEGTRLAARRIPIAMKCCGGLRRERAYFTGRLHEKTTSRMTGQAAKVFEIPGATYCQLHYGYIAEAVDEQDKAERNRRIVEGDGRGDVEAYPGSLSFERGRTAYMHSRFAEAIDLFSEVVERADAPLAIVACAHRFCHDIAIEAASAAYLNGNPAESARWTERARGYLDALAAVNPDADITRMLLARDAFVNGDYDATIRHLDGVTNPNDSYSQYTPEYVHLYRAKAWNALGDLDRAWDAAVAGVLAYPESVAAWTYLLERPEVEARGVQLCELAAAANVRNLLGWLSAADTATLMTLVRALMRHGDDAQKLTASAAAVAALTKLDADAVLDVAAELEDVQPTLLVDAASDTDRTTLDRLRLAAEAAMRAGDDELGESISDAAQVIIYTIAAGCGADDLDDAVGAVAAVAPGAAAVFGIGFSSDIDRLYLFLETACAAQLFEPAGLVAATAAENGTQLDGDLLRERCGDRFVNYLTTGQLSNDSPGDEQNHD